MKIKNKISNLVVSAVFLAALASCDGGETSSGTTFRYVTASEITSLDYQYYSGVWVTDITSNAYEGLLRDEGGIIVEGMADTYTISDDGLTYTFHIRDDAAWTDGTKITAQTFYDSWLELLKKTDSAQNQFTNYFMVESETKPEGKDYVTYTSDGKETYRYLDVVADGNTLTVKVNVAGEYVKQIFAQPALAALPVDAVNEAGGSDKYFQTAGTVFNGPFEITEWKKNDIVKLEKNEDYWNAENVNVDNLEFYYIPNAQTAVQMYLSGQVDMVRLTGDTIDTYSSRSDAYQVESGSNGMLQFDMRGSTDETGKFLNNRNFQLALSNIIDREEFVMAAYGASYKPTVEYIPTSMPGYVDENGDHKKSDANVDVNSPYSLKANEEEANRYLELALEELGYTKEQLASLEFKIIQNASNTTTGKLAAEYMQSVFKKLGVNCTIEPLSNFWSVIRGDSGMRYDFYVAANGPDLNDPMTYLSTMNGKGNYADNFMHWQSEDYAALLEAVVNCKDEDRKDCLVACESYLLNNGPFLPLFFATDTYLVSDAWENVNFSGSKVYFTFVKAK